MNRSNCVFVGNIPYDATEEQLTAIFNEVGHVVNFRLVFDRDTGKAKGYGFCEFRDSDTALSAMRNLNGRDLNGRSLRVDFADGEKHTTEIKHSSQKSVQSVLDGMSKEELHEVLWKMKLLIQQNEPQAKQILTNNPQLAYSLLQAQVMLGLVDGSTVQELLSHVQAPTQQSSSISASTPNTFPSSAGARIAPPIQARPQIPPTAIPFGFPQPAMAGRGPSPQADQPPHMQHPLRGRAPPPPRSAVAPPNAGMRPPTHPQPPLHSLPTTPPPGLPPPSAMPALHAKPSPQQKAIQELLSLTPQDLAILPPAQRQQLQELQAKARAGQLNLS